jgi:hypothetical protein
VLESFPPFSVQVFDTLGQIIEGARVHGRSRQGASVVGRLADGLYYSRTYPFRIFADALDRNLGVTEVVTVERYQPEIRLEITAGGELQGSVADADGLPVKSFTLILNPPGLGSIYQRIHSEEGFFRLVDLPQGRMIVKVRAPGFEDILRPVLIQPAESLRVEITLLPTPPKESVRGSDR